MSIPLLKKDLETALLGKVRGALNDEAAADTPEEAEGAQKGLQQLDDKYGHLFKDIIVTKDIKTKLEVINCILTYDSKHAVAICCDERQKRGKIVQHSLKTAARMFEIDIEGEVDEKDEAYKSRWIVANEIEQKADGTVYAIPYNNNGAYRVSVLSNTEDKDILG